MKSIYGYLAGTALGLALVPAAHAQTMYGVGTCTGTNMINGRAITGTTQLFVGDPDPQKGGALIPASFGGAVFNQAECQCQSRDISMHFILTGAAGPGSAPGTAMYIGQSGCEDPTTRAVAICDQVSSTHPANNTSWILNGASFQSIVPFDAIIPPEVVTNPKSATNYTECKTGGMQNYTVTVTVGPDTMSAVCTLPLVVNTQGPPAPEGVAATKGDAGMTIDWAVPSGTSGIDSYQVLCRKKSAPQQPAMAQEFLQSTRYYFSSCINKHLYRRTIGGLNNGNDPATTTDNPISTTEFPLDPRLRCSDRIMATTTQLQARLSGLTNGEAYEVMVVAIDTFGNPTGSAVVTATPQANAGPLDAYCEGAACPGFGCQAGRRVPTAAGAGVGTAGLVALGLLLLARRTRRAG